jgi:undecaprenyl-diphosphatase
MLSNIIEIVILSLVQGISEFLPISSSAHLIVVSTLYEFKSTSLLIDVSLHLGSLLAIIYFFRKELFDLKNNQKLLSLMIFGSIPLILFGYILYKTELIYALRDIKIIAWTTLIFAIILYLADKCSFDKKITSNLNLKIILYIGLFQTLALVPGVSRAGITITAARIFRFNRPDSSKISFLLAIPALTGAIDIGIKYGIGQTFELNNLI